MSVTPRARVTLVDALATSLEQLGCELAFGVNGAAVGRFVDAAARAGIAVLHTRHEAGAAFMAAESGLARDATTIVFTTSGPGWSNALTGLVASAWEGADVVAVVGGTARDTAGRLAFQETGPQLLDIRAWLPPEHPFTTVTLRDAASLQAGLAAVARGRASARGSLTILLTPSDSQQELVTCPWVQVPQRARTIDPRALEECARRLVGRRVLCWVGHEARRAIRPVRSLVEALGASVLVTPRGKGVFSERHPAFVGVTGLGGARGVRSRVEAIAPDVALVLGARLGEFNSWWDPALQPPEGFVHVGEAPTSAAYPDADALIIRAEIASFARALRQVGVETTPTPQLPALEPEPFPSGDAGVHPAALMAAVQSVIVEGHDVPLLAGAGNSFAWAARLLQLERPRLRVSPEFGSMGHVVAGVVGVALARGGKAVALVGDGAMLMNNELNTAAQYGAQAVWIVLNDASYGMIRHGMEAIGLAPIETQIPRVDFVQFARAQGVDGVVARSERELPEALSRAMAAPGPFVVDVRVDADVAPPFGPRNDSLRRAGEEARWRG